MDGWMNGWMDRWIDIQMDINCYDPKQLDFFSAKQYG